MRKGFLILCIFLFCGVLGLYGKKINYYIIGEKPEKKTVRFLVYAGTDYSTSLYKKSKAKVVLTIWRFSDDKSHLVWEGLIDYKLLKNYPRGSRSIFKEVCVYDVFDQNETLAAYYTVEYDSKGSKMSYEEGKALSRGSAIDTLNIKI